ncbi:MAG: NUDIX hydrolase N-terminal domain-containing protein [Ilumatobacteraceae bacterium]
MEDDAAPPGPIGPAGFTRDLVRWSEALAAIARTGLGFTESLYERERFEEVLNVAADIKAAANEVLGSTLTAGDALEALETAREQDHFVQEWLESVGVGVPGYVTPKVAIGAVVGNDAGKLLLVQRADSGIWLYPTGWADVGYSPAEVAVKEVAEETGIECEVQRVLAVIDGQRMGFSRFGMYMVLFHCTATGGELTPHPLECADVGWFGPDELPTATAGAQWWSAMAFAAIEGQDFPTIYDAVRSPIWRA